MAMPRLAKPRGLVWTDPCLFFCVRACAETTIGMDERKNGCVASQENEHNLPRPDMFDDFDDFDDGACPYDADVGSGHDTSLPKSSRSHARSRKRRRKGGASSASAAASSMAAHSTSVYPPCWKLKWKGERIPACKFLDVTSGDIFLVADPLSKRHGSNTRFPGKVVAAWTADDIHRNFTKHGVPLVDDIKTYVSKELSRETLRDTKLLPRRAKLICTDKLAAPMLCVYVETLRAVAVQGRKNKRRVCKAFGPRSNTALCYITVERVETLS